MLLDTSPIKAIKHGRILTALEKIYSVMPRWIKPKPDRFFSFKNKILFSTLFVLAGGIICIAAVLQILVIPQLKGDPKLIFNLKMIHLIASLLVLGVSWIFVELISKKITNPLRELTKRADEISREIGETISSKYTGQNNSYQPLPHDPDENVVGDEIDQLTASFNNMLAYLMTSQAQLRESEEKYRFLFDHGPIPKFVVDADNMTILDVNNRAEYQYQYSRQELIGKCFTDLAAPRESRETDPLIKIFSESKYSSLPIIRHLRKDGSTFLVNMEARLSGLKDKPALIIAVWDVTEKLEQQAQLLQAGKMATLGEMATGLAHELNQPLNVIRIASDFLQKKLKRGLRLSDDELFKTADELEANVERATRIITHLREFGYKAQERMERISVATPINGVYTMLNSQLTKRGISWEVNIDDDLPEIMGDENRLEQVFINLVLNARDAMLEHEKKSRQENRIVDKILSIKAFQEKNNVVVTVSDTGPGVSIDLRQKIFEPFFTSKKVGEGTGIGLSISYNIIKEHKGSIEVMGNGEKGAIFRLTFPALNDGSGISEGDQS